MPYLKYLCFCDECVCSDNIQSSHSKHTIRIVDRSFLQYFARYWYCAVDRIRDDRYESFRCDFRHRGDEIPNDRSVRVEEVITSHAWFAWNSSRYNNDLKKNTSNNNLRKYENEIDQFRFLKLNYI